MSKYKIYDSDGKVEGYLNTDTAKLLAGTFNDDRKTRGSQLYMTPRSKRFFVYIWSMWVDEGSSTDEITKSEAIDYIRLYGNDDENEILKGIGAEEIKDIE